MARTEIVEKRGAKSKVFDNGDGTFTLETGGHAHHLQNGSWIPTDTTWGETIQAIKSGTFPYPVEYTKQTKTLSIIFPDGTVSLTPANSRNPSSIVKSGNTLTISGLWRGIDLKLILVPEGIKGYYTRTSSTFTNPSYNVTGPFVEHLGKPYYVNSFGLEIYPPTTLVGSLWTLDMSNVPIGVEVDPTLTQTGATTDGVMQWTQTGNYSQELIDTAFATARAASTSSTAVTTGAYAAIPTGYDGYDSSVWLRRIALFFDTASIDDAATIESLSLTHTDLSSTNLHQTHAVSTTNTVVNTAAYAITNWGSASAGQLTHTNNSAYTTATDTLDKTKITVNKAGTTPVGLRSLLDLNNTSPLAENGLPNLVICLANNATVAYRPVLNVVYNLGGSGSPAYYYNRLRRI